MVKGTVACQEISDRAQVYGAMRWEARVIWRRLDCLKPNLQLAECATPVGKTPETDDIFCSIRCSCVPQPSRM